ncbi:MAG: BMC domain-containing protein [Candidatus Hydrogenedentota bacterium]|nr:MAG: BMC domain-containing protein [Candidatus Hydrogenedentota bacterium]
MANFENRMALGMVELSSIARGYETADLLVKEAHVELLMCRSICSGKFMILFCGDVDAVESSVARGVEVAAHAWVDSFVIPDVHPGVLGAIRGTSMPTTREAMGVVESFSVSSLIEGLDAACKEASIELVDVRLAMALGGKAYLTLTGPLADVRAAVGAAVDVIARKGLLVDQTIIPNPREEIYREII